MAHIDKISLFHHLVDLLFQINRPFRKGLQAEKDPVVVQQLVFASRIGRVQVKYAIENILVKNG
jgi:hypothetical protein